MKRKVFIDMDGTIVRWNSEASIEEVSTEGYFKVQPSIESMVEATRLMLNDNDIDVYILSSVFRDEHSIEDKNFWLDRYLPHLSICKRIYVPYGESKWEFIKSRMIKNSDISLFQGEKPILIDDFTKNLKEWEGVGIKCLNGINNTKGTWDGYFINAQSKAECIYNTVKGICRLAS